MSEAVIAVESLVKNYGSGMRRSLVHAVRGLSLTVPKGSVVACNDVVWAPLPVPPLMRNRMPAAVQQRPTVDYAAQRQQTAETAAYAGAYFLGCVFFTRRDLKFS